MLNIDYMVQLEGGAFEVVVFQHGSPSWPPKRRKHPNEFIVTIPASTWHDVCKYLLKSLLWLIRGVPPSTRNVQLQPSLACHHFKLVVGILKFTRNEGCQYTR